MAASVGGWKGVCGLRVMQGLCQGFIFPSTHTLLSKWAPVTERAKLGTFSYAGAQFGTVLMLSVSGFIASSAFGWPGIFYVSGGIGIVWSLVWSLIGYNTPAEHRRISPEEKSFIEKSLGTREDDVKPPTPWKDIFTSLPFISLIIVHCGHNWGFWTLLTEMPTYMKNVLELDIKKVCFYFL